MTFDFVFRNARIAGNEDQAVDIGIRDGRFIAVEATLPEGSGPTENLSGRLVVPGFVETHIHLDKSCLLGRCNCEQGTLDEAIAEVAAAKKAFTDEDVYARARSTLEKSLKQGTTRMRTHVEVDPRVGLTSFRALKRLKDDYAWAIDLELCVFPQEGLLDDPGCEDVMIQALRFDVDIDFHLDFGLDPAHLDLVEVCRLTDQHGLGGRVAIGHVTKLSAVPPQALEASAKRLAAAGVAITVLPSTDLFLTARDHDHNVPRGVTPVHRLLAHGVNCSISTNNVLNPFTPFGDCSLIRMANLYANIAQVGASVDLAACLDMVSAASAKLLNHRDYGIAVGHPADLVVLDCESRAQAVCELAQPIFGLKRGRRTFDRPLPRLHHPA